MDRVSAGLGDWILRIAKTAFLMKAKRVVQGRMDEAIVCHNHNDNHSVAFSLAVDAMKVPSLLEVSSDSLPSLVAKIPTI